MNPAHNCIQQTEELISRMEKDLESYSKRPAANKLYVGIIESRIKVLNRLLDQFIELGFQIEDAFKQLVATREKSESTQFRLEACLIYHGVSVDEIRRWMLQDDQQAADRVKTALKEKWRQTPLGLTMDDDPEVRYSTKPLLPPEVLNQILTKKTMK